MITLTDVFTFNKPVIVVKRDNYTYYLTDTPQSEIKPNFPVPAIPTRVEYVFGYGLADGIFVRVEDYIVCGAYADGLLVEGYPPVPYAYDYPDTD